MLWLMIWPMLVALALWGGAALFLWSTLALRLAGWLQPGLDYALSWTHVDFGHGDAGRGERAALPRLRAAGLPDRALHPRRLRHAADGRLRRERARSRPRAPARRRHRRQRAGTAWSRFAGMLVLFLLSLPLWLFPPLWPIIPLVILAG